MSNQDVLVLAEIQRAALADATLELLAAARGSSPPPAEKVVVAPGRNAAGFAAQLGRGRPHPRRSTTRCWPPTRPSRTWPSFSKRSRRLGRRPC